MKKSVSALILLIILTAFYTQTSRAEIVSGGAQKVRIIVLGLDSHDDYDYVFDGIRRINGVSDLTLARISSGFVVFTGFISTDVDIFTDDIQGFAAERFSFNKKSSGDTLELTLKKL